MAKLIGGKTLEFYPLEQVPNLSDEHKRYLRRLEAILEELNRRTYDLAQHVTGGRSGAGPFVAKLTSIGLSYQHTADIYEWYSPGVEARKLASGVSVVDLVEYVWSKGNVFEEADTMIVWRTNNASIAADYAGFEFYGTGSVGPCPS